MFITLPLTLTLPPNPNPNPNQAYSRTLMGTMQLPPPAEAPPAAGGPGTEPPTEADGGRAPPYYGQQGEQGGEGVNAGHGGGAASAPFEIQLPSMRLAPRASPQAPASPTQASPPKAPT